MEPDCESESEDDVVDVEIDEPVLLIRINKLFRPEMTALELYEATRGVWRISERRERAVYAFALYQGIVQEVYEIERWDPALTAEYATRAEELASRDVSGRWEFTGTVASGALREKYVGKPVKAYLSRGLQNPIVYVNA